MIEVPETDVEIIDVDLPVYFSVPVALIPKALRPKKGPIDHSVFFWDVYPKLSEEQKTEVRDRIQTDLELFAEDGLADLGVFD